MYGTLLIYSINVFPISVESHVHDVPLVIFVKFYLQFVVFDKEIFFQKINCFDFQSFKMLLSCHL